MAIAGFTWWAVPPVVIAFAVNLFGGLVAAILLYGAFNGAGVWLYCSAHGPTKARRRQLALKVLTLFLLPTGIAGMTPKTREIRPSEEISINSPDPEVRTASTRLAQGPQGGWY